MKMNKKGFTLIELLAVIVILSIIMVIAVPQILDVIEQSRSSAWKSNVKLIEESLELNTTLSGTGMSNSKFDLATECATADTDITSNLANIADISAADTVVTCKSTTSVQVEPKEGGQFKNQPTAIIEYSNGNFTTKYAQG